MANQSPFEYANLIILFACISTLIIGTLFWYFNKVSQKQQLLYEQELKKVLAVSTNYALEAQLRDKVLLNTRLRDMSTLYMRTFNAFSKELKSLPLSDEQRNACEVIIDGVNEITQTITIEKLYADYINEYCRKPIHEAIIAFNELQDINWLRVHMDTNITDFGLQMLPGYQATILQLLVELVNSSQTITLSIETYLSIQLNNETLGITYRDEGFLYKENGYEKAQAVAESMHTGKLDIQGAEFRFDMDLKGGFVLVYSE